MAMIVDDRQRAIGKVVSVAADRLVVEMRQRTDNFTVVGYDDMHYVATLGSFVIIPVQATYVVAEVVGLREKDTSSGRQDAPEGMELAKANAPKFLDVVPVGTLPVARVGEEGKFRFGVSVYPSLYTDALYATDQDLDRIFEVSGAEERVQEDDQIGPGGPTDQQLPTRLQALGIGRSVIFQGYEIKVKLDEFFGCHSAILGNTGSGKSCTVAAILQSLFAKQNEYLARGATFLILDVNGEYRRAFSEVRPEIQRRYLQVPGAADAAPSEPAGSHERTGTFRLPHWFMSVEEWELLLRASERTQRPVLRTALGLASLFADASAGDRDRLRNHILASCFRGIIESEMPPGAKADRILGLLPRFQSTALRQDIIRPMVRNHYGQMVDLDGLSKLLTGLIQEDIKMPVYTHSAVSFDTLEAAFDLAILYEEAHGNRQIRDYCSQMITRYKWVKERPEFAFMRVDPNDVRPHERSPEAFVSYLLGITRSGATFAKSEQIILLDFNEAEDEVVEVVSAVTARMIFDTLRKADPRNILPVHVVLEEAHRYIAERPSTFAIDASRIFERVAKEGRKYGMFLMLASQRPSELSRTVLSQCANFVIHRIQNPEDLQHIKQMTPFISESVLKRLPSLPKQHALIFGNAVNMPTTFRVRDASPRPKSDDARIPELWFHGENRPLTINLSDREPRRESVTAEPVMIDCYDDPFA